MANSNHETVDDHLKTIQDLYERLLSGRQEYDFMPPAIVSHASDYASDPVRLRRYAGQVINARLLQLLSASFMKTQCFLEAYIHGIEAKNPYLLFMTARSQIELYAIVADTLRVVKENVGDHEERFAQRVIAVDTALVNTTYGTRSDLVKKLFSDLPVSKLRKVEQRDLDMISAKNILTRIDRLSKTTEYPECKKDYERLCEYLHPNIGQNILLMVKSPVHAKFMRLSLKSEEPMKRAINATVRPMALSARGTIQAFDNLSFPFQGQVTYPQK